MHNLKLNNIINFKNFNEFIRNPYKGLSVIYKLISDYPRIQNLLKIEKSKKINFFVSDNDGASSSIFKFGKDSVNLRIIEKKLLKTITLDSLLKKNNIEPKDYDFWVIDLQGVELLALKGAKKSLKHCKAILIEISKKEQYINGAKWKEVKKMLNEFNFKNKEEPTSSHQDVLFVKQI